jgi:hypothetical protein
LPVPILVENEHLQIWQLLTALLAVFELKCSHLHIVSVLAEKWFEIKTLPACMTLIFILMNINVVM